LGVRRADSELTVGRPKGTGGNQPLSTADCCLIKQMLGFIKAYFDVGTCKLNNGDNEYNLGVPAGENGKLLSLSTDHEISLIGVTVELGPIRGGGKPGTDGTFSDIF
jgi:hypothetical protein